METSRIGILGSGDVGRALGRGFARHGWDVKLGTRNPDELRTELGPTEADISVGTFAEAAAYGDVVILAVLGDAAEAVVELAGEANFSGKLVLDATNPLDFSSGVPHLSLGGTTSLGERIQEALPEASVVKCFNTVSNMQMVDPEFEAGTPPMFICGNDDDAKTQTEAILVELGWPGAMDVGDITSARYLEALVPLWVRVGSNLGTWKHAFTAVQ
ncbi:MULTISPECIES: NADPH-dependent F420 reductase [Haloferax]|uniref:DNA-binding protein n=2 Tax=Haloferax TaxID=2251 RepID=A0A6G1YZP3_9EURY|nr:MULTISPECIES: NAD(P)-binding domain-containing protein [Haloferax]KAB1186883.1 DNA-binding protein [Haloferax sp. CBA1149]MRW79514.1 DNA-binding protein [Haloferax marinisediminis]